MINTHGKHEVYFVYLGQNLPKYVNASLDLADTFSGLDINFIGNSHFESAVKNKNINFISVESFYNPDKFELASRNISFSHNFWNGFWLKTLERFFVIEQFMESFKMHDIFHAELDQLLFRCDELLTSIECLNESGIFLPFVGKDKAVASIFYCNDLMSLKSLLDYSIVGSKFNNEMELISNWASQPNSKIFALPTFSSSLSNKSHLLGFEIPEINSGQISGIVDAAELGQWIAGNDPRNVPISEKPRTHFLASDNVPLQGIEIYKDLTFSFDNENRLFISNPNLDFSSQLFNLHIHSKIHRWFKRFNSPARRLIWLANQNRSVVIIDSRLAQIRHFCSESFFQLINHPEKILRLLSRLFFRRS